MMHDFIYIAWAVFWVYWLVSAIRTQSTNAAPSRDTIWVKVAIILIVILVAHNVNTNLNDHEHIAVAVKILGLVFFVSGLLLAVWARVHLGKNWGMPMTRKHEPKLVSSGPYKYVRHPIYTGIMGGLLGTALTISLSWLLAFFAISLYFIYSALKEEQYLEKQLGKTYKTYKKSTKMLVPFVI